MRLQQCLPLAVLKLALMCLFDLQTFPSVATVLTACGIETIRRYSKLLENRKLQQCLPLAVLKRSITLAIPAVVPKLQQCLPLAVLKQICIVTTISKQEEKLQQCLPLAVLKL